MQKTAERDEREAPDETSSRPPALPKLQRPARFVLAGASAAMVNFFSRVLLSFFLPYAAAIVIAYAIGMATAFLLNRQFVFKGATNRLHEQVAWFIAVNALAAAQTLIVSLALADYILPWAGITWHAHELAHAAGIVAPIFTSYVGHKRFTFR